jgi:hypothetical protein
LAVDFLKKLQYAFSHPDYLFRRIMNPVYAATGYDEGQWARVVMYEELMTTVRALKPEQLRALEISPGGPDSPWRQLGFREYAGVDYPEFDICNQRLEHQFDIIIADQVFEHLLWPYRAARNIQFMLKQGGYFISTTPFLIRVHRAPSDCSRWTETGMKYLLAEAGFDLDKIRTGSWGNRACVRANLRASGWAAFGWGQSLRNEQDFPIAVWAIAEK